MYKIVFTFLVLKLSTFFTTPVKFQKSTSRYLFYLSIYFLVLQFPRNLVHFFTMMKNQSWSHFVAISRYKTSSIPKLLQEHETRRNKALRFNASKPKAANNNNKFYVGTSTNKTFVTIMIKIIIAITIIMKTTTMTNNHQREKMKTTTSMI